MDYYCYIFQSTEEIFLAYLAQLPFDSMVEEGECTLAYIAESSLTGDVKKEIQELSNQYEVVYDSKLEPKKNWNAVWESSFEPVEVDDFVRVRADFHDANGQFEHDIVINPKMSFGTGHHETTFMMMKMMKSINLVGKSVLDYGSGTGILSILASKLGASDTIGVDIEEWAYENSIENMEINKTQSLNFIHGDLSDVPRKKYDVILANITKNVLIASAEELHSLTHESTELLLSGILLTQKEDVIKAYSEQGFHLKSEIQKGKWCCLKFNS